MHRFLLAVIALLLVGAIALLTAGVESLGMPGWITVLLIALVVVFGGSGLLVLLDARRVKDGSDTAPTGSGSDRKHAAYARGMGADAP